MSVDFDLLAAALAEGRRRHRARGGRRWPTSSSTSSPKRRWRATSSPSSPTGAASTPERMQALAREMNLSETVFVLPAEEGGDARIRIFTPLSELPFAGHPTLGSAFADRRRAGQRDGAARDRDRDRPGRGRAPTGSGPGSGGCSRRSRAGRRSSARPSCWPRSASSGRACRSRPTRTARSTSTSSSRARRRSRRSAPTWRPWPGSGEIGANCFAGSGLRWKTRMFAPADGVPEDPGHRFRRRPARGPSLPPRAGRRSARRSRSARALSSAARRPSCARASGSAERVERVEVAGGAVIVAGGRFSL